MANFTQQVISFSINIKCNFYWKFFLIEILINIIIKLNENEQISVTLSYAP